VQLDEGEGGVAEVVVDRIAEDVAESASAASAAAGAGFVLHLGSGFGQSLGCFAGGGCVLPCSRLRAVKASTLAAMVSSPRSTASAAGTALCSGPSRK
tara:strand:- start:83 stop:376 length:294 start_codon:yes stop_codon:yes gene_type:complete